MNETDVRPVLAAGQIWRKGRRESEVIRFDAHFVWMRGCESERTKPVRRVNSGAASPSDGPQRYTFVRDPRSSP
ncbi:hypothetical protein KH5H1_56520 [Corallococcus caeni]|nr:hypothetical protein KH5H1_56520 [Corallococcus sp. KH5-1]